MYRYDKKHYNPSDNTEDPRNPMIPKKLQAMIPKNQYPVRMNAPEDAIGGCYETV
jgi:hypothetical protein